MHFYSSIFVAFITLLVYYFFDWTCLVWRSNSMGLATRRYAWSCIGFELKLVGRKSRNVLPTNGGFACFFFILLLFPFHVRREKTLIIDSFHIIIILICVDNWLIDIETTLIQSFSITHDDHSSPFSLQFLLLHKNDCCFFLSHSKCSIFL